MKWSRGSETVDRLLAEGRLQTISGDAAHGQHWLWSATALLESARREADRNPEVALVLAYDCARRASSALLAQQGLRTKSGGHHVTVEDVVRAQFDGPFRGLGWLRRRRSEVEYPLRPGDDVRADEASEAIGTAAEILAAAESLLPELQLYR